MITSSNPSPLTSPAPASDSPKFERACSPYMAQYGSLLGPVFVPPHLPRADPARRRRRDASEDPPNRAAWRSSGGFGVLHSTDRTGPAQDLADPHRRQSVNTGR